MFETKIRLSTNQVKYGQVRDKTKINKKCFFKTETRLKFYSTGIWWVANMINKFSYLQLELDTNRKNSTQKQRRTRIMSKSRIKSFGEHCVKGVEVDQDIVGDSIEGQDTSRTVHKHSYSVREWVAGRGDRGINVSVPDNKTSIIREVQTPGLIIPSKQTVITVSFPSDSSITHWYTNASCSLHLPVTSTSQTVSTQQLRVDIKSVWMLRIQLDLPIKCHLSVIRKFESSVYGVCVDRKLTGIWQREQPADYLSAL